MNFCTECGSRLNEGGICPNCAAGAGAEVLKGAAENTINERTGEESAYNVPQRSERTGEEGTTAAASAVRNMADGSGRNEYRQNVSAVKEKLISPWGYVGYGILFSVPVIGIIFAIIWAFDDSYKCRRNFARSIFCNMLIAVIVSAAIFVIILLVALIGGASLAAIFNELQYS